MDRKISSEYYQDEILGRPLLASLNVQGEPLKVEVLHPNRKSSQSIRIR